MVPGNVGSAFAILILSILLFSPFLFSSEYINQKEIIENSADCLDCHEEMVNSLSGSAHQIFDNNTGTVIRVGCVGCHDGWAEHLEDPNKENISQPKSYSQPEQAKICGRCHQSAHQISMLNSDPHGQAGVACVTCHSIHDNSNEFLLSAEKQQFCVSCHSGIAAEFKQRSAHPYESENIYCTDCHLMGETEKRILTGGLDWTCQNCHSDYAGPFLHEHPVTSAFYTDGGGCVECHQPHGSNNERLLNQPGQGVCLQCHGMPPAHLTAHSGLGSRQPCMDCHTQIHGSFDNSKFLDPNFGAVLGGDCFQSGCHILGE
ncbi:MAG: hypothetical protein DRP51_11325 [Candidatus Zixiibacteriota bacterium]|nr:MAG: hypothetical protein DRP51_11325 [candidate division Zixibacteria bacterium]